MTTTAEKYPLMQDPDVPERTKDHYQQLGEPIAILDAIVSRCAQMEESGEEVPLRRLIGDDLESIHVREFEEVESKIPEFDVYYTPLFRTYVFKRLAERCRIYPFKATVAIFEARHELLQLKQSKEGEIEDGEGSSGVTDEDIENAQTQLDKLVAARKRELTVNQLNCSVRNDVGICKLSLHTLQNITFKAVENSRKRLLEHDEEEGIEEPLYKYHHVQVKVYSLLLDAEALLNSV